MKNYRIFAEVTLFALMTVASTPTRGQANMPSPVPVKKSSPSTGAAKGWMKAEVIHADSHSIIVREDQNGMMIHTFTYAPGLQPHMEEVANNGGYQYGDKIKILYQMGQTVALKIHGKPSKSL